MRVLLASSAFKFRLVLESLSYFNPSIQTQAFVPAFPELDIPRRIRDFRPNIVWTDHPYYANQVPEGLPVVMALRGDWWTEYNAMPPDVLRNFLESSTYQEDLAGFQKVKRVLPLCDGLMKRAQKHYPNLKYTIIPQGVDGKKWQPLNRQNSLKHPSVAIAQNHAIRPKFEGLYAFVPVIKAMPHIHFYIAQGQSKLEKQSYFMKLQTALKDSSNVTFVDVQTPDVVNRLFTETDLYVLASGLDWCPTTVLEAGLMERCTVGSRIEGIVEVVQEGINGFTAENGNVREWKEAIEKALLLDGRKAREHILRRYDWSVVVPRLEAVLNEERSHLPNRFYQKVPVSAVTRPTCPSCSQLLQIDNISQPLSSDLILKRQSCRKCGAILFQRMIHQR